MTGLHVVGNDDNSLGEFVDYLYGGLSGYVSAATKRVVDDNIKFERIAFQWPDHRDHMIAWINGNTISADVYLAPAIFSEPSGKREHFKASNVSWVDFDGQVPASDKLGDIPDAGLKVQSSGPDNQHWYWRHQSPILEIDSLEGINRSLAYQLGGDVSGWDAGQILRPPSTINHKPERNNAVAHIIHRSDAVVTSVEFGVLPPVEAPSVTLPSEIPDVTEVVLKYAWTKEASDLYRSPRPQVGDADRSNMLMHLGHLLAEMGLSDGEMYSVLRNADDRWAKFKDRTDRDKQLTTIIGVARRKHPETNAVDAPVDAVQVFGLKSFLATEIEIEWVMEGLLQTMGYMLLTGPSGVGKTQFSLRAAISLALGRDFLGFKVDKPHKILFLSLEMGHADLKYFLSIMAAGMSEDDLMMLEQNLLLVPVGEAIYLDQPEQQAFMEDLIREFTPTGIFIDSVGSSTSGDISGESTVKALMDFNDRLRQRHNVFTWYIHHNRKAQGDNKKPNKLPDVYGNQYLVNRATSVYCLWPAAGSIEVYPLKKRLAAMEDPWFVNRMSNLDFIKKEGSVKFVTTQPKINLDDPSSFAAPSTPFGQSISDL